MPKGRGIHRGRQKMVALARLLYRAKRIAKPTLEHLAAAAKIPMPTFNQALTNQSISTELEEKLRTVVAFNPGAFEWIDERLDDDQRKDDHNPDYKGRDTLEAFQTYFEKLLFTSSGGISGEAGMPSAVDKNLLCHEVEIARTEDGQLTLCLQVDFGTRYDPAGIKYVLGQAQFDVEIGCTHGHATARLGQGEPYKRGMVTLSARGTDRQPRWDIVPASGEAAMLAGLHELREPPLATLQKFKTGARIETRMRVNIFGGMIQIDPGLGEISGARAAVIESIFERDLAKDSLDDGWVTLSKHDLTISGGE